MFLQFLSSVKFQSQVVWVNFDRRGFFFFFLKIFLTVVSFGFFLSFSRSRHRFQILFYESNPRHRPDND